MTAWYESVFDEDWIRLAAKIPAEKTEREAAGIAALLRLQPGQRVLDLCCGHGRHAIVLARRGLEVVGQDLSEPSLARARAAAEAEGLEIRWQRGDMREIPAATYDAVFSMFTSFGYFETEAEDERVLAAVASVLAPGGRFLLDVIHREGLARIYLPAGVSHEEDGTIRLEERRFDFRTSRNIVNLTTIGPDGARREAFHSVRVYTLTELATLIERVGLHVTAWYGSVDGSPLRFESHRLVLVAAKDG